MGIGINNHSDSAIGTAIKTGTKAGAAVALIEAGKALAPTAKEAFATSLTKQADLIDKFQKSGLSVEQYMINADRRIQAVTKPTMIYRSIIDWSEKQHLNQKEIFEKVEKMEKLTSEIHPMGLDKAYKKLGDAKELFETGKTSKNLAFKDSVDVVLNKVKNKTLEFTDCAVKAFKTTDGTKTDKFKAVLKNAGEFLNNNPAIKKGGQTALIAAAVVGGVAFVAKAVSSNKDDK